MIYRNKNFWKQFIQGIKNRYKLILPKKCTNKNVWQGNHNVAPKQVINPDSPLKDEQLKFIDEGGDSQPLDKK